MSFPTDLMFGEWRELGLVLAVLIGFGFGFVLERAGFGRATTLAAQFYLTDMTVFKVMFGAIVTAMLGAIVLDGIGLLDLARLSAGAVSATYIWPMAVGGFALGVGFVISGYCPGTSVVATASGNLDGLVALLGIAIGSLLYGEFFPLLEGFATSGAQGQLFLYEWLGLSPAWVAALVTVMAVGGFLGAEAVERWMARRAGAEVPTDQRARPKRWAFGLYAGVLTVAVVTVLFPAPPAAQARQGKTITAPALAMRIIKEPWRLRILDLRSRAACGAGRVPGAACVTTADLEKLALFYGSGARDLILVAEDALPTLPAATRVYRGQVFVLQGGFAAWQAYALTTPEPLTADAGAAARRAYEMRVALHRQWTGRATAAPPPPAPVKAFVPKKKSQGGGCD